MAAELAALGIRVNAVEPGWIDTPGERKYATDEEIREAGMLLPLGRLGSIEDIAKGVAYLASDDAAYVTGSILRIDGGYVVARPK
jgi:glucose 1-dehydrogenase